ncbi:hypothetical protein FRC11_004616 [Ceratobasidium sp. 423]|nr:hypothetical protein FRC11_004616 [Ceratobasidium sp. 423]
MPGGTNWMGGRGKKAKRQSGLKILEHGGNTEQHFARLRAVTSNLIVQDQSNGDTNSKATPLVSFKHAQSDSQGAVPVHAVGTDGIIHPSASIPPRVLDRPNKPTKQNRLPELMETAVRNIESLDAKRAHINSIDARSLAGLDIASRKRKYGAAPDGQGQVTSKPFYYLVGAKPRAFAASSPEPPVVVDTCAGYDEDMLSFGTPSDKQSANGTQAPILCLNREVRDEQMADRRRTSADATPVSTTPAESQSSTKEIDIPPTLYEDSFRAAAQTLKLQDALLGVQTNTSLSPWHTRPTRPSENDSEIRAFNLFTPAQVNVLDGIPLDPEPRTAITFQGERNPKIRLSAAPDEENRLDIGNQIRSSLGDLRDHNQQHGENDKASDLPVKPHGKPRMETPQGTKPPPPQAPRKRTGNNRNNFGRGSIPLGPLDRYVPRSHPGRSRRVSDPAPLPSDHSNAHGRLDHPEPIVAAKSVPSLGDSRATMDFGSVGSSPGSSQEIDVSLTTGDGQGDGHHQTIGLQLFDDHPQAGLEMGAWIQSG